MATEIEIQKEMREVITSQLRVAEMSNTKLLNWNIAGMILAELDLKYGIVKKQIQSISTETEHGLAKAEEIHGDGYFYERKEGTEVDLRELRDNQRVCAGGENWHILMTEKPS